jgi:hypothetical protein
MEMNKFSFLRKESTSKNKRGTWLQWVTYPLKDNIISLENIEVNNNLGYIHTFILKKVVISTLIKH